MANPIQPRSDITEQKMGDELMLFDNKTDKVHVLNSTSAFIWKCLKEGDVVDRIAERIRVEYDTAAMPDLPGLIQRALRQFVDKGLVVPSES